MSRHDASLRAQRILAGLCIQCGHTSPDAHRCDTCRSANAFASAKWRAKRKAAGLVSFIEHRKDDRIRELQLKVNQIDRGIAKASAKRVAVAIELQRLLVLRELQQQQERAARAPVIHMPERPSTHVRSVIQREAKEAELDALILELQGRGYVPSERARA